MRRLIRAALIAYLLLFAVLFLMRHAFVLPFDQTVEQPVGVAGMRVARLPGEPELELWIKAPRRGMPVVLLFGGNGGRLHPYLPRIAELTSQGVGVVAMGYRGSGGRPGEKSEAGFYEDARRAYDALGGLVNQPVPPSRVVLYGISLGTGVASKLATQVDVAGVVLEMPYTRICDVAFENYPIFPTCLAMYDLGFDNINNVAQIDAPLLVMHGRQDKVVPFEHGERVFAAALKPKRFVRYEGGRHHDLRLYGSSQEILKFLREHLGKP